MPAIFNHFRSAVLGGLIALLSLPGCFGGKPSDLPKLAPVTGQVTLDGKPLPNALVTFLPKEKGRPSSAKTDEAGKYRLSYLPGKEGAVIGRHTVMVSTEIAADYDTAGKLIPGTGIKEEVPEKYNAKTTLEVDVGPEANQLDLKLSR